MCLAEPFAPQLVLGVFLLAAGSKMFEAVSSEWCIVLQLLLTTVPAILRQTT